MVERKKAYSLEARDRNNTPERDTSVSGLGIAFSPVSTRQEISHS
jgi:hypothetical protein